MSTGTHGERATKDADDRAVFEHVRTVLGSGRRLEPGVLAGELDR